MNNVYIKTRPTGAYPYKIKEGNAVALRAIIFDCDGVLVDSEPIHFSAFKKSLEAHGLDLTEEAYKERYLPLDDKGVFSKFFQDQGKDLSQENLATLVQAKGVAFHDLIQTEGIMAYPAVPEVVMAASQRYPLAIASGARRHELEVILEASGLRPYFEVIISADDVEHGKPHPESFLKAVDSLNASGKRSSAIRADECAVIEDSREGIVSAHTAGMKCVAVATSYPAFELSHADLVLPALASLKISQIEDLFQPPQLLQAPAPQNN
ncbi:MAG: Phosphoglycolate phosphatase [Elusimicrobia bacterium]|nr:Phosphoglycolate phosphatase [Elusimicrobiota bacterium]